MIFSGIALFVTMFISFGIYSEYFEILFTDFGSDWESKKNLIYELYGYENYIVEGYSLLQLIAPVFPIIAILPYFNEKNAMAFSVYRYKNPTKSIIKRILKYCLSQSIFLFFVYIIYAIIGLLFVTIKPPLGVSRELFSDILGTSFYTDHMFGYFIIEGFWKFFVFGFVYALFSIASSFIFNKTYQYILFPILYLNIISILLSISSSFFKDIDWFYFAPTYTIMSNAAPYKGSIYVGLSLIPILVFSIITILGKNKLGDDLSDKQNDSD